MFWLLLFLIAFIVIYNTYKDEYEEYLVIKAIGYYFLSSFTLYLGALMIPVGFLINILFIKPDSNKSVKRAISYLGLAAAVLSWLFKVF